MASITIWALESDYDAKVVHCLAQKFLNFPTSLRPKEGCP
jgi:hypothetical protein